MLVPAISIRSHSTYLIEIAGTSPAMTSVEMTSVEKRPNA